MMNKKGFTLIELLTVIAVIAIIGLIAVPNMIGISDDIKKEDMLSDAKKLISLAKLKVNTDYNIREFNSTYCTSSSCDLPISLIDINNDLGKDPDDDTKDYEIENSYVRYYQEGSMIKYCIHLESSRRVIGKDNECKDESELFSKSSVEAK